VSPTTGRWLRTTVRRYPHDTCPECGFYGALRRKPRTEATDPDGWLLRKHKKPGTRQHCTVPDTVVLVKELPEGWT
jgi:hypothetical protein